MERGWVEPGRSWHQIWFLLYRWEKSWAVLVCDIRPTLSKTSQLVVVFNFFNFFLKNNTNITWKRLLKIITMLQDSRFDTRKEEEKKTHLHKSIYFYILIFIWRGYGPEEISSGKETFFDIEPLHLNKEMSNTPGPKQKKINHTSLRVVLDKVMKFSEK